MRLRHITVGLMAIGVLLVTASTGGARVASDTGWTGTITYKATVIDKPPILPPATATDTSSVTYTITIGRREVGGDGGSVWKNRTAIAKGSGYRRSEIVGSPCDTSTATTWAGSIPAVANFHLAAEASSATDLRFFISVVNRNDPSATGLNATHATSVFKDCTRSATYRDNFGAQVLAPSGSSKRGLPLVFRPGLRGTRLKGSRTTFEELNTGNENCPTCPPTGKITKTVTWDLRRWGPAPRP